LDWISDNPSEIESRIGSTLATNGNRIVTSATLSFSAIKFRHQHVISQFEVKASGKISVVSKPGSSTNGETIVRSEKPFLTIADSGEVVHFGFGRTLFHSKSPFTEIGSALEIPETRWAIPLANSSSRLLLDVVGDYPRVVDTGGPGIEILQTSTVSTPDDNTNMPRVAILQNSNQFGVLGDDRFLYLHDFVFSSIGSSSTRSPTLGEEKEDEAKKEDVSPGIIAGATIGGAVLVVAALASATACCCDEGSVDKLKRFCITKRKRNQEKYNEDAEDKRSERNLEEPSAPPHAVVVDEIPTAQIVQV